MTEIKAIDKTSIHRITSGQVIVDLATAVKELVENSLDAGASNIEVRFKNQGLTSFEVIDDGSGIEPSNYTALALKHHTSKITRLDDLLSVQTFGFRGEALASLCAMCERVTVTTATAKEAPMGTVLVFKRSGELESSSKKVARQRGTTVLVEKLFAPLPVRRHELERQIKRDFARALNLLQAYALVPCVGTWTSDSSPDTKRGVRLTVSNQSGKSARQNQIQSAPLSASEPLQRLRANVSHVWGPKTLDHFVPLELDFTVEPEKSILKKNKGTSQPLQVRVRGLISKFTHMSGRLTSERQFYYLNGRPFEPKPIQKAFNEVYKSFNPTQQPMVIADFQLPGNTFDINVSPDKRMIMLHNETGLITALKAAIETAFADARSTYTVNDGKLSKNNNQTQTTLASHTRPASPPRPSKKARLASPEPDVEEEPSEAPSRLGPPQTPAREPSQAPIWSPSPARPGLPRSPERASTSAPTKSKTPTPVPPTSNTPARPAQSSLAPSAPVESIPASAYASPAKSIQAILSTSSASWSRRVTSSPLKSSQLASSQPPSSQSHLVSSQPPPASSQSSHPPSSQAGPSSTKTAARNTGSAARNALREKLAGMAMKGSQPVVQEIIDSDEEEDELEDEEPVVNTSEPAEDSEPAGDPEPARPPTNTRKRTAPSDPEPLPASDPPPRTDSPEPIEADKAPAPAPKPKKPRQRHPTPEPEPRKHEFVKTNRRRVGRCPVDLDRLKQLYKTRPRDSPTPTPQTSPGQPALKTDWENDNATQAEQQLSRVIQKADFLAMEILGQFNLGFVIVRLRKEGGLDDLFIIDQHAADEKFNFERLQRTTKIQSQRLIKPRLLELSVVDEMVALDHIDVLKKNGFVLQVDKEAPEGERPKVRLVAQPMSKNVMFDMKDLEEILHQMKEGNPSETIRCSKARAMFAMRACRSSIMIGTALKHRHMVNMVRNLAGMDQPWNCPHGRPTMRHLCNLRSYSGREAPKPDWAAFEELDV